MRPRVARRSGVLHVTTVHPPLDNRINLKECATLARAGYEVALAAPEAPDAASPVPIIPMGRPRGRLRRVVGSTVRATRTTRRHNPQVVHVHDPELLPFLALQRLLGRGTIYDAHEDLPATVRDKAYLPRAVRPVLAVLADLTERGVSRLASHVVAATPSIADRFGGRCTIVQNFPRREEFSAPGPVPHRDREPLVVHVGALTRVRGAFEMTKAMSLLSSEQGARLALGGSISPGTLRDELSGVPGWGRVEDLGWLARDQVTALLGRARAGLLLFHPLDNHVESQPTKLFEYLASGLPVIASDFPYWRSLVGNDGAVFVDPLDPASIAAGIDWVLDHPDEAQAMGARGRALVLDRFTWGPEGDRLVAAYRAVVDGDA